MASGANVMFATFHSIYPHSFVQSDFYRGKFGEHKPVGKLVVTE